jgi:hypothetical protein
MFLPHARYILESNLVNDYWENRINLARKVGMCLYSDGRFNEAEALDVQVIETSLRVLGAEHPSTLNSMLTWLRYTGIRDARRRLRSCK